MSSNKEVVERIRIWIDTLIGDGTVRDERELAELMGYSPSSVRLVLNEKSVATVKFVNAFARVDKRINPQWIATGEGKKVLDDGEEQVFLKEGELCKTVIEDGGNLLRIMRVKNVLDWLKENGIASSNRRVAELMGYNPSTLSLILNNCINVKERFAFTLCSLSPKLNAEWVLSGEGGMLKEERTAEGVLMGAGRGISPCGESQGKEGGDGVRGGEHVSGVGVERMEYLQLLHAVMDLRKRMDALEDRMGGTQG